MKWLWSKRWVRLSSAVTAFLLLIALAACWRWRIWSLKDYREYQEVCSYPIGRDLWFGRIGPGRSVKEIMDVAPPHRTQQLDRFTCLVYYPGRPPGPGELPFSGLEVVAKDGRLVRASAGSCTWARLFFDLGAADAAEYEQCLRRYCEEIEKRLQ